MSITGLKGQPDLQVVVADTDGDVMSVVPRGSVGAATVAIVDGSGNQVTSFGGAPTPTWYVHHVPAANTQATITQSAAGVGVKNACLGFTVTLASSSTTAPAAIQLTVALIDGASGGTTYLWRSVLALPAVAGAVVSIVQGNAYYVGSANTALTLEFSAAGGANTIQSVSMRGTTA